LAFWREEKKSSGQTFHVTARFGQYLISRPISLENKNPNGIIKTILRCVHCQKRIRFAPFLEKFCVLENPHKFGDFRWFLSSRQKANGMVLLNRSLTVNSLNTHRRREYWILAFHVEDQ